MSEKLWRFIFRWLIQIAVIRYAYLLVFFVHRLCFSLCSRFCCRCYCCSPFFSLSLSLCVSSSPCSLCSHSHYHSHSSREKHFLERLTTSATNIDAYNFKCDIIFVYKSEMESESERESFLFFYRKYIHVSLWAVNDRCLLSIEFCLK